MQVTKIFCKRSVEAIKSLHTSMIDTERAYDKAQNETDDTALKALFGDMKALREHSHDEPHRVLLDMGQKPDDSVSFLTTVHQAVIGLRAATVGIGRGALRAFLDGEGHILYDKALQQAGEGRLAAKTKSKPFGKGFRDGDLST